MTRTEVFEQLRPLLFSIAYRILGSVSEAEDALQESWLRYESSPTQPRSTKAFLSAAVTRISIDVLRSARVRREKYVGQWFPEPPGRCRTRCGRTTGSWPTTGSWTRSGTSVGHRTTGCAGHGAGGCRHGLVRADRFSCIARWSTQNLGAGFELAAGG